MTIRSILGDSAAMIGRGIMGGGLALSRGLGQVRPQGAGVTWADAPVLRRVWALKETKKSRGWLVGLALVALAFVVSLFLA
jgi:hypothetical protein